MSFFYQVILRPSDVKFTCAKISPSLGEEGVSLESLVSDVKNGRKQPDELGVMEVVWLADKWEWCTLNNELLWVLRELENCEELRYVSMRRVEYMNEEDASEVPTELFDSAELMMTTDVDDDRCIRSRSASVCSTVSDDEKGKDDWGRRGRTTNTPPPSPSSENISRKILPQKGDHVENESNWNADGNKEDLDENHNEVFEDRNSSVLEWVETRKKFCTLYSKDYNFQEYVAQNISVESPSVTIQPSQSLLSLNSDFTTDSVMSSQSIISRDQRKIDPLSGYSGYGNFFDYNEQYLSKLREARLALRRKLKPFDVSSSRSSVGTRSRRRSSISSCDAESISSVRKRVTIEERITRTYSESIHSYRDCSSDYRYSRRTSARESSRSYNDVKRDVKGRSRCYSEGDRSRDRRQRSKSPIRRERRVSHPSQSSSRNSLHSSRLSLRSDRSSGRDGTRRSLHGSCSSLRSSRIGSRSVDNLTKTSIYGSHSSLRSYGGSSFALKLSSVPKEKLFEIWQRRRESYLRARYDASRCLEFPGTRRSSKNNSLALTGYTCGLCFKSFETRVRREQHSEELLHYACITCGRFFASHVALGQHVEQAGHRKD
eukprot:gene3631-4145_t